MDLNDLSWILDDDYAISKLLTSNFERMPREILEKYADKIDIYEILECLRTGELLDSYYIKVLYPYMDVYEVECIMKHCKLTHEIMDLINKDKSITEEKKCQLIEVNTMSLKDINYDIDEVFNNHCFNPLNIVYLLSIEDRSPTREVRFFGSNHYKMCNYVINNYMDILKLLISSDNFYSEDYYNEYKELKHNDARIEILNYLNKLYLRHKEILVTSDELPEWVSSQILRQEPYLNEYLLVNRCNDVIRAILNNDEFYKSLSIARKLTK